MYSIYSTVLVNITNKVLYLWKEFTGVFGEAAAIGEKPELKPVAIGGGRGLSGVVVTEKSPRSTLSSIITISFYLSGDSNEQKGGASEVEGGDSPPSTSDVLPSGSLLFSLERAMNQRVGYQYLESPSIVHQFPFVIYELSAQNNIVSGNNCPEISLLSPPLRWLYKAVILYHFT